MLLFWAAVVIFIIISLVFLLPPLLKKHTVSTTLARKDLTVGVFKGQFEELENDLKNGVIAQEQYDAAKIDLEKNLLEDVGKAEKLDAEQRRSSSPLAGRISAILVAIAIPVSSVVLYSTWGAGVEGIDPESIPEEVRIAQQKHNEKESIDNMVVQLETKLKDDPSDGESWFMLARTYQFLKRYADAVNAYEKALPLGGSQSADVLSSYADAIAMASNRELTVQAVQALEQAVEIDPTHIKSLWLLGTAGYQNREYPVALKYWERLYAALPADSQEKGQVLANLNDVRGLMGMAPMTTQSSAPSSPASPTEQAEVPVVDARVQGSVALGGAVAAQALPEDTVYVFARAATGPRMPLAIIRKQVKDIPFDFTLDDSLAMNPSMKLSSVTDVIIGARVSKTGNAMPQPGDLEVLSSAVKVVGGSPVNLVINHVLE